MTPDPDSRYAACPLLDHVDEHGVVHRYLDRRFLPPPHRAGDPVLALHQVTATEVGRLDNVAARHLRRPEQYWVIADAHRVFDPDDITRPVGRMLVIPVPPR